MQYDHWRAREELGADGSRVEGGVGAVMRTLNLPTSVVIVPNVDDDAALRLDI
jgi:hypothetical protein